MSRSQTIAPTSSKKQQRSLIGHAQDRLFAQRLDHEAEQPQGPAICTNCTAVSSEKRWCIDPELSKRFKKDPDVRLILCPGCDRVKRQLHEGEVILESSLLAANKDAAMALIKHTEGKAWHDNPMSRIASINEDGQRIEILTTTKWLANRIGKEFYKAYKGKLELKPSYREKFIRVHWSR